MTHRGPRQPATTRDHPARAVPQRTVTPVRPNPPRRENRYCPRCSAYPVAAFHNGTLVSVSARHTEPCPVQIDKIDLAAWQPPHRPQPHNLDNPGTTGRPGHTDRRRHR